MNIGYATVYGWWKEPITGPDQTIERFDKYAKALKKVGVDLLFYAGSYGVPEPAMYVVKFKDIKDWEKTNTTPDIWQSCPLDKTRTVFGWDYSR